MQVVGAVTVQALGGRVVQAVEARLGLAVEIQTRAVAVAVTMVWAALAVRALSSSDTRWPHNG